MGYLSVVQVEGGEYTMIVVPHDLKSLIGQYPDYKEEMAIEFVTRCLT